MTITPTTFVARTPQVEAVLFDGSLGLDWARELAEWCQGLLVTDPEDEREARSWVILLDYHRALEERAENVRQRGVLAAIPEARVGDYIVRFSGGHHFDVASHYFGAASADGFDLQFKAAARGQE